MGKHTAKHVNKHAADRKSVSSAPKSADVEEKRENYEEFNFSYEDLIGSFSESDFSSDDFSDSFAEFSSEDLSIGSEEISAAPEEEPVSSVEINAVSEAMSAAPEEKPVNSEGMTAVFEVKPDSSLEKTTVFTEKPVISEEKRAEAEETRKESEETRKDYEEVSADFEEKSGRTARKRGSIADKLAGSVKKRGSSSAKSGRSGAKHGTSRARGGSFSDKSRNFGKKSREFGKKLKDSVVMVSELDGKKEITVTDYIKIAAAVVILIIANLFKVNGIVELLAYLIPFFLISYDIFFSAIRKINRRKFPKDEAIVIGCSILSFCIGAYTEAVAIPIVYKICLILYDLIKKSREKTDSLLAIGSATEANIKTVEGGIKFDVADVICDDIVQVDEASPVPLDGVIETGRGAFDISILTGEDTTVNLKPGDRVAESSMNVSTKPVTVRITADSRDSSGHFLRNEMLTAANDPSDLEKLIYKVMRLFSFACIPVAIIIAVIPGIITDRWFDCISRAVLLLFVSQVKILRDLILYIFNSGIVHSALSGIFITANKVIGRIRDTEIFVFEKSGVITEGDYSIRKVTPVDMSEEQLLEYAAVVESRSNHPLALTLKKNTDPDILSKYAVHRFTTYPGAGVSAYINGKRVFAGKYSFVSAMCDPHTYGERAGTNIHLCIEGKYSGCISFSDRVKEGTYDALEKLRSGRSAKLVMLTGDSSISSRKMAAALNFDMIKAECAPHDKKNSLDYLIKNKNKGTYVTYIGNSRTNSEILESAEVAITYSSLSDDPIVNPSADVIYFGKGIDKVADTISTSDTVIRKVQISAIVYSAVKALVIIFGMIGILHLLPAIIIDGALSVGLTVWTLLKNKC